MANEKRDVSVIWDLDGVIIDSFLFHLAAWREVGRQRGRTFTEDDFRRVFGAGRGDFTLWFFGPDASTDEVEAVWEQKENIFRNLIKGNIEPLPGVLPLLRSLKQIGVRMALATLAHEETIELVLSTLDIKQLFECVVSGRELREGKITPEGFLIVANRLGVAPASCVVIEDAITSIAPAKAASMKCVAVTNTYPRESLAAADLVVDSLEELDGRDIHCMIVSPQ